MRARAWWICLAAIAPLLAAGCTTEGAGGPCGGVDCSWHGICAPVGDSPYCLCYRGYHPVLLACVADNPENPCAGVSCDGHGYCRVEAGAPVCDCDPGYQRHPGSDMICVPVASDGPPDELGATDADPDVPPDESGGDDAPLDDVGTADADVDAGDDAGGPDGPCAEPGVPEPSAPANGAATGSYHAPAAAATLRPLFRWRAPPADGCPAPTYEIQVDNSCVTPGFESCSFAYPEAAATGVAEESWRPAIDLSVSTLQPVGMRYYWRVRACRGAACSAWSRVRYVDVGRVPRDFNGDGWSDVVLGCSWTVTVVFGGAPMDTTGDVELDGLVETGHARVVSASGDVNADGFADLLVAGETGGARLYLGAAVPDSAVDGAFSVPAADDGSGYAVSIAGDVNADGFADLLVGAPGADAGGEIDSGQAHLYLGRVAIDPTPSAVFVGAMGSDRLGTAVAGAGDMNGDGYAEIVIGAPGSGGGGRAYVVFGGVAPDTIPDLAVTSATFDQLGSAVAGVGDVNGDDYGDVLLGAPGADEAGFVDAGRAYLLLGGPSPDETPDVTFAGAAAAGTLGYAAAGVGDVNGDGFADLAIAFRDASGGRHVAVHLGGATPDASADLDLVLPAPFAVGEPDLSLGGAADLQGDGFADVVVGGSAIGIEEWYYDGARIYFGGSPPDAGADLALEHVSSCSGPIAVAGREALPLRPGGPRGPSLFHSAFLSW